MRALGFPIAILAAGCSFQVVPAAGDARVDGEPPAGPMRKRITIDPARVNGTQTAFPVWFALDDADLKAHATETGVDIYFTDAAGAALPHQIQRWDRVTGRLEAWVRADLNDTADTVLELRYGRAQGAPAADAATVFSNSFAAVWHLDDRLDTAGVADARNQRNGTAQGGLGPSHQVAARLGGGVDFDGANARIEFMNPYAGNSDHTFSAWVNLRTASNFDTIVALGSPAQNQSRFLHAHLSTSMNAGFFQNDWPNPGGLPNLQNAGWTLVHWTYKGSNKVGRIYRDGVEVASHTFSGTAGGPNTPQSTVGYIGYALQQWGPGGSTPCALNGVLDEVRLATAERSAGWIATEFANQSSPQTFYAVGPEEPIR